MSAEESKKTAEKMKKAEITRLNSESVKKQVSEVDHLFNHFQQLINKASNKGQFTIERQTFAADRFRTKVIDEVVDKLQDDGYKVQVTHNNALQQLVFNISW